MIPPAAETGPVWTVDERVEVICRDNVNGMKILDTTRRRWHPSMASVKGANRKDPGHGNQRCGTQQFALDKPSGTGYASKASVTGRVKHACAGGPRGNGVRGAIVR
jgi:hypothetical protein